MSRMAPQARRGQCQVCVATESKYTCSGCMIVYCSVACYKQHKASSCQSGNAAESSQKSTAQDGPLVPDVDPTISNRPGTDLPLDEPEALRPLTSLRWPYVPEESAYPDPLKRDDPKSLQLPQYEAIATSPAVRKILADQPKLRALLTSVDTLRGPDREHALQRALGVTAPDISHQSGSADLSEDVLAFRALAEAIEAAVRGGNRAALGLDWGGND